MAHMHTSTSDHTPGPLPGGPACQVALLCPQAQARTFDTQFDCWYPIQKHVDTQFDLLVSNLKHLDTYFDLLVSNWKTFGYSIRVVGIQVNNRWIIDWRCWYPIKTQLDTQFDVLVSNSTIQHMWILKLICRYPIKTIEQVSANSVQEDAAYFAHTAIDFAHTRTCSDLCQHGCGCTK